MKCANERCIRKSNIHPIHIKLTLSEVIGTIFFHTEHLCNECYSMMISNESATFVKIIIQKKMNV
jgi:hypothetical protein